VERRLELLRAVVTFGWQGSARTAATLNQETVSMGAQNRGKEKGQEIRGSGSRIRRPVLGMVAVLGGFRRAIAVDWRQISGEDGEGNGEGNQGSEGGVDSVPFGPLWRGEVGA
jgi:hypothetical protein